MFVAFLCYDRQVAKLSKSADDGTLIKSIKAVSFVKKYKF